MPDIFVKTKNGTNLYFHDVQSFTVEPCPEPDNHTNGKEATPGNRASNPLSVCDKTNCKSDTEQPYVANTECNHESGEDGLEADIRCDLNCEKEFLSEKLQEIDGLLQALDRSTIRTTLKLLDRVLSKD